MHFSLCQKEVLLEFESEKLQKFNIGIRKTRTIYTTKTDKNNLRYKNYTFCLFLKKMRIDKNEKADILALNF